MASQTTATARLTLDTQFHVGEVDRRIFSGFLEHLGRAVYEGVYDPGSPLADKDGFRRDVIDALRPMNMPLVRYPGGNFVSSFDWKDGVGPRDQRPRRPDFAWRSIESNQFGTDEFMTWCAELGTAPMMAVNLGTAGAAEAGQLLEYCNLPTGTLWADRRAANGHAQPYGVKVWCLGNEMDGPWQAGHVPAEEYARRARAAGAIMKGLDPSIETVACGSSARGMATYLEYDRITLDYCWEHVDFISAHRYSANDRQDTPWYLAEGVEIDRVIEDYAGLLSFVRGRKRSNKRVYLSFDEWNVWYKDRGGDGKWGEAPHLLEEIYNLEDALVCAQYLAAFVRRADVVKVACIAQIVNVIAPILTRKDQLLLQSIYWPFVEFSQRAKGVSLTPIVRGAHYKAGERGEVPSCDAAATYDAESGEITVFLTNRDVSVPLEVEVSISDRVVTAIAASASFGGMHPTAANTWDEPQIIKPTQTAVARLVDGKATIAIPSPGFSSVTLMTRTA